MSRLGDLTTFVKLVVYSGWVTPEAGDKHVSAMLVARFESGKTSVLNQFLGCEKILYLTDATEYGILHEHFSPIANREVRHVVIPDFIKCVSKRKGTVDTLITFFNSFIEEGVYSFSTYATHFTRPSDDPLRGGLITSIAVQDFNLMRKRLTAKGFLSRFLVMSYDYDEEHVDQIFEDISGGHGDWGREFLDLPDEDRKIHLSPELARLLVPRSRAIGERLAAYGFRAQHQFQQLVKASALMEGRDMVVEDDVTRVLDLSRDYLGLRYNRVGVDGSVVRESVGVYSPEGENPVSRFVAGSNPPYTDDDVARLGRGE